MSVIDEKKLLDFVLDAEQRLTELENKLKQPAITVSDMNLAAENAELKKQVEEWKQFSEFHQDERLKSEADLDKYKKLVEIYDDYLRSHIDYIKTQGTQGELTKKGKEALLQGQQAQERWNKIKKEAGL